MSTAGEEEQSSSLIKNSTELIGSVAHRQYKSIDKLCKYKRNKDAIMDDFIDQFQRKYAATASVGLDGILGYLLLKNADLAEEVRDEVTASCKNLTFVEVEHKFRQMGAGSQESSDAGELTVTTKPEPNSHKHWKKMMLQEIDNKRSIIEDSKVESMLFDVRSYATDEDLTKENSEHKSTIGNEEHKEFASTIIADFSDPSGKIKSDLFACNSDNIPSSIHHEEPKQLDALPPTVHNKVCGITNNPRVGGLTSDPKPQPSFRNRSYADCITQAIESSLDKRLSLAQIYEWMVKNVDYLKDLGDIPSSTGWKNSIRQTLSVRRTFKRTHNWETDETMYYIDNNEKQEKFPRRTLSNLAVKHASVLKSFLHPNVDDNHKRQAISSPDSLSRKNAVIEQSSPDNNGPNTSAVVPQNVNHYQEAEVFNLIGSSIDPGPSHSIHYQFITNVHETTPTAKKDTKYQGKYHNSVRLIPRTPQQHNQEISQRFQNVSHPNSSQPLYYSYNNLVNLENSVDTFDKLTGSRNVGLSKDINHGLPTEMGFRGRSDAGSVAYNHVHPGRKENLVNHLAPMQHHATKQLSNHVLVHHKEKQHKCSSCHKEFNWKGDLNRHQLVHTKVKPFQCGICDRRFSQSGNLDKHIRIHLGEKHHKCEMCDKDFTQSIHLQSHQKNCARLMERRQHKCPKCPKRYFKKKGLKVHMKIHNKEPTN